MIVLDSGDKIQGDAENGTEVDYTIYGLDNNALKQLADGQLADSTGDLFTADSVDVVTSVILVNTGASAQAVNLFLLPSGGTARRLIPEDTSLGASYSLIFDGSKMAVYGTSGGLVATITAHKDDHDPEDGDDALDCAAPSELASVQAAGEGSAHTFARSDHAHQIQHSIADNHLVTIDGTTNQPVNTDYAKFTASGLEGMAKAQILSDINVEDGADVTDATNVAAAGAVMDADFTAADEVMVGTGAGTHGQVTLAASQFLAKKAAGTATNVTATEARTILNVADGANAYVHPNHSGEVTSVADGAQTIANDAVTYAKMQNVSATDKVLGRATAGAGDVEEIACTAFARSILDDANEATFKATVNLEIGTDVLAEQTVGIANDNLVEMDDADAADNDYAKFTAAGLEGRSYAEVKADLDLEIGTDVLAEQTIGIADDNLLEVDDAAAADDDFARFTANGIEGIPVATAIAALLGAALPENTAIILDSALSADGKYSGIVEAGTAGATLAFGDLVYLQTADSRWELASADDGATGCNFKLGICVLAAADDASATAVLLFGKVRADTAFPALTVGAPVYMGTTAGDVQTAAPSGSADIVRIVGYGNTGDELYFCPENDWITLA